MDFERVEAYRVRSVGPWDSLPGDRYGAFQVPGPCGPLLRIIASDADEDIEFEHVSVSLKNRTPNWAEMCFVKDLFWSEDEAVMQLHPPKAEYINNHEFCLHLWRPVNAEIPLPPSVAVGFRELNIG